MLPAAAGVLWMPTCGLRKSDNPISDNLTLFSKRCSDDILRQGIIIVIHQRTRQLLFLGLIMLLGIQLTGLDCLDEWSLVPAANSSVSQVQPLAGSDGVENDACPCHLIFVSIPSTVLSGSSPSALLGANGPAASPSVDLASPFHPPRSL